MTKKERIAELERRVAELEARTPTVYEFPATPVGINTGYQCHGCGAWVSSYGHLCMARWATSGTPMPQTAHNFTVIGAAS